MICLTLHTTIGSNMNKLYLLPLLFLLPLKLVAEEAEKLAPQIAIDSFIKIADKKNASFISVINAGEQDAYLMMSAKKVLVENNKLVKKNLNIKNMANWKLAISPGKMILRSGEEKKIKLSYLCDGAACKRDKDEIYQISIAPVPYNDAEGASSVSVAFGFAPYFIVPASESNVKYSYDIKGKQFILKNEGNTYINAVVSICKEAQLNECIYEFKALPGRTMKYELSDSILKNKTALMTVINHDQSYKRSEKLNFN